MKKYNILIECNNVLLRSLDDKQEGKYGFFATRFIEAKNMEEAEEFALNAVREELHGKAINKNDDPPVFNIEEINEVNSFDKNNHSDKGFTWYKEED